MPRATLRARVGATAAVLTTSLAVSLLPVLAPPASAAPTQAAAARTSSSHHSRATSHHRELIRRHDRLVHKVIREARKQKGKPYRYGGAGPHSFDCSGLVMYVYEHAVHRYLPHNAAAQYHSLQHIKRRHLRKGDLIFTDNGYISHVGIFAGHHHWWVAPHTGTRVHKQRIYHAHFVYARVLVIHHHH